MCFSNKSAPPGTPGGALVVAGVSYWLEIYNGNDQGIDVSGFSLCRADPRATLGKVPLVSEARVMPPGSFLVVRWDANRNADTETLPAVWRCSSSRQHFSHPSAGCQSASGSKYCQSSRETSRSNT